MEKFELILNKSYGNFIIGEDINKYLHLTHTRSKLEFHEDYEFIRFKIHVWVKDNIINTICCDTECYWKGYNLINMPFEQFLNLSIQQPDGEDICYVPINPNRGQNQKVYDFDKLGLQIWVWRNKIKTVLISNYEDGEGSCL